ncbi:MAG: hypothetical protein J1F12_06405 [Muribaculaceae bacterium]|nr:hypothetical protein [Muribaculaceae bacterium]
MQHLLNDKREAATHWTAWGDLKAYRAQLGAVYYAKDVDTYFIVRSLDWEKVYLSESGGNYTVMNRCILQTINIFGKWFRQ